MNNTNHANLYCKTPGNLSIDEAICALHQAHVQFFALEKGVEGLDNRPVMTEIARLLGKAGHIGFESVPEKGPFQAEAHLKKLEQAFDRVKDPRDWKAPIAANVLSSQLDITCEAIGHFTGTEARFCLAGKNDAGQPIYHVTAPGYRAGPAGDH